MIIRRKAIITLLILGSIVLFLIFFAVKPIFSQIKKESENFVVQKKELIELEAKIKNIHDFRNNFEQYRPNLEKIDSLFVNAAEPIEFIEFLEKKATTSGLSIGIFPSAVSGFSLKLDGHFPDFLRFLERLEYGPYLVTPADLRIGKISDKKDGISATLLIKSYTKSE